MRPRNLDEYIGQQHILAPERLLRRAISADQLSSLLFYGPPGTGKTTLASVIANTTSSAFVTLNAVMAGIADLKAVTAEAQRRLGEQGQRTILFIDEVHRWNRAQQDALLPWVENGTVILIGATTENPYFTVNRALVSRSRIFQLKPLTDEDIRRVLLQAVEDRERGFGRISVSIREDALAHLANIANGDARAALNALELAVETTPPDGEGRIIITLEVAEESIQRRAVLYDREGDCHYDTISAFIKSMRGSDPDAALHYLARLLEADDLPSACRRLLVCACEDVGLAYPQIIPIVKAAVDTALQVGLPEARIPLADAVVLVATSPKSNSAYLAMDRAMADVRAGKGGPVPRQLQNKHCDGADNSRPGQFYRYAHDYPHHWVRQQYLPDSLKDAVYYEYGENKNEQAAKNYWDAIKKR
jgi:putative ATPase